jgi:hypothetical protein
MSDEFLPLIRAAEYVGVSRVKLAQLARDGVIAYTTSPLDKRVKLFRREDLDQLKQSPRPTPSPVAPAGTE